MTRISLLMLALLSSPVYAGGELTDEDRAAGILALKLGYILNGDSMKRWGSIDLTGPKSEAKPEPKPPSVPVKPKNGRS